jgi:hypothetical protein
MVNRDSRLDILLSYDTILPSECNYMGGTYNTCGGTGGYVLLAGKPEGRVQLEDLGLDRRIKLNGSSRTGMEGFDWIDWRGIGGSGWLL